MITELKIIEIRWDEFLPKDWVYVLAENVPVGACVQDLPWETSDNVPGLTIPVDALTERVPTDYWEPLNRTTWMEFMKTRHNNKWVWKRIK